MKISQEVQTVLSAAEVSGNQLKLTGQLDRKLYQEVDKVISALGGKWNRKAGAHIFGEDVETMIDDVILTGQYSNKKSDFGQFDTPPELAQHAASLAGIFAGAAVLEPNVGIGNLAQAAADLGATLFGYEIDEKRLEKAQSLIFFEGGAAVADFLQVEPSAVFDAVLMNPPFAKQADIIHVLHAHKFLREGGRLVSIMSAGVKFRVDKRAVAFRDFVKEKGGHFEDVEEGAFKSSGTGVRTVICVIPS